MKNRLLLFLALLLTTHYAHAQQKVSLAYYHNPNNTDVTSPLSKLTFTPFQGTHELHPLANKGVYLFKVTLSSPPSAGGLLMEIANEHLDSVFLYRQQADGLALVAVAGNNIRNDSTLRGYPQFIVYDQTREYYIKINYKKDVYFQLTATPLPTLLDKKTGEALRVGAYYGLAGIIFLINLILFRTFKDRIFIYYSLFQLSIFTSIFSSDGLLSYVTTNTFILNNADLPLHLFIAISGFMFSSYFMGGQNRYLYRLWILLLASLGIMGAYTCYLVFNYYPALLIGDMIVFSLLLVYWIIGLITFKKNAYSRYFVFAYGVYLLFAIDYYLLRKFGVFFFDFMGGQLKVGSFVEMIVLSLAIIYRVNQLKNENEHYRATIEKYMQDGKMLQDQSDEQLKNTFERAQLKYNLTDREMDVLKGITEGLTNIELANKLFVSPNTIKFHTRNIFDKMEITNRSQAINRVQQKEQSWR